MKRLRLFVFDGSAVVERTYSRLPIRIGRHPRNECQILDPRVSRFHALFDSEGETLVFRDVESQNGTVVLEGALGQILRGTETRAPGGRLAVLIGGVRVQARLEEHEGSELPETFLPAVRDAARALIGTCPRHGDRDPESAQQMVDALFESVLALRVGLQTDEADASSAGECVAKRSEAVASLLQWTQATGIGLRHLEYALGALRDRQGLLLDEAGDAIDALLSELSPERLERETHDVCAEWPAARATAVLARYKEKHRALVQRHASRPSVLLGQAFAEIEMKRSSDVAAREDAVPRSEKRARLAEGLRATSSDTGEHPPSSG
ncbi:MAG: FHA domain-containing protein [Polyangiaceae bacterium]